MQTRRNAPELLEREAALGLIGEHLLAASEGAGSLVLVEGPAGAGKTALLRRLREDGAQRGLRTLQAVGGELEREFAFGLVRQLFEPVVQAAAPAERERLLAGAAAQAAPVVGADPAAFEPSATAGFATLHGLYWFVATLAEQAPLLLVVDDVHWGDAPSLRFLDFLARRVPELPLMIAAGLRPHEPGAEEALLAGLAEAPEVAVVRPAPLSAGAVRAIVDRGLGERTTEALAASTYEATGGNPLLVRELVRSLAAGDAAPTPAALRETVPASVGRLVRRRLARLDPAAAVVAGALAALGDHRDVPLLVAVSGLDTAAVRAALRVLRDAELVDGEPPAFVHPLVRQAVADALPERDRDRIHRRAPSCCATAAPTTRSSCTCSRRRRWAIPWVVPFLRAAGLRALADGAPDAAVRRLQRALEEHGEQGPQADALRLELGLAAMAAGDPIAVEQLARAAHGDDPLVALRATETQIPLGAYSDEDTLEQMLARMQRGIEQHGAGDPVLSDRLRGRVLDGMITQTRLSDERARMLAEPVAEPGPNLLAHLAWEAACGDASAEEIMRLSRGALAQRPFTRLQGVEQPTAIWAVMALTVADGAQEAEAALDDAEATLRRQTSLFGRAFTSLMRAEWLLAFGSATLAEATARESVEPMEQTGNVSSAASSRSALASALVLRGELDAAEAALAPLGDDERFEREWGGGSVWASRAELRLAQGRPREAIEQLRRVEALCARYGWRRFARGTHVADLARALAMAGELEEARALAEAEAADARRRGVVRLEAVALVALGLALEGDAGLEALHAAVELAGRGGPVLVQASAALELGAALRRANRRVDARERLSAARDLAHRVDARLLLDRATEELTIAGGRPRRIALSGADALTPSERRVAEQAARGLSNREIAETLFVTRKTVESQLGASYSKLGIRSRSQLAEALADAT